MSFDVPAGNGFQMRVEAVREAGRKAQAEVSLYGNNQNVVYVKRGGVHLTRNEIAFRLGSLGSVDMTFDAKRRFGSRGQCNGAVVRKGTFRGRLHFRGEDSYSKAHAGKTPGHVQVGSGDGRCGLLSRRDPREPKQQATLTSCGPGPQLNFVAIAESYFGYAVFSSALQERVDGIDIYRTSVALDIGEDFVFDEKGYRSARVRPSWPFAGTGVYRDGELTGDLSVSFAGRADVPLAPSDRAKLRKAAVPGRSCGVEGEPVFGGFFSAPAGASAPEDPAAVGFDRR